MKCVCPMGGDRVCPDDCPIATWWSKTPAERKLAAPRKAAAMALYPKYTMEQIATMLGVSQKTISKDLDGVYTQGINSHRPKGGRPKGAGRRKGNKRKRKHEDVEPRVATLVLDEGKTHAEVRAETGVSDTVVRHAVAREEGRREAEPTVTPDMLSMSAQQKLDAATRQHQRKLNAEHAERMREIDEEVRQRVIKNLEHRHREVDEAEKKAEESELLFRKMMKPTFTVEQFKTILMCLHPDGARTADKLSEAFRLFNGKKLQLTGEA